MNSVWWRHCHLWRYDSFLHRSQVDSTPRKTFSSNYSTQRPAACPAMIISYWGWSQEPNQRKCRWLHVERINTPLKQRGERSCENQLRRRLQASNKRGIKPKIQPVMGFVTNNIWFGITTHKWKSVERRFSVMVTKARKTIGVTRTATTKIFVINWTLGAMETIYIDLPKPDTSDKSR